MDAALLIQYLQQQRFVLDYMTVSTAALFIYDYLLTLHLEIKLIWSSKWSSTKVLFLLVRYLTFGSVLITVANQTFLGRQEKDCSVTVPMESWFLMMGTFFSEVVLAIRTWAVWRTDTFIGIGLAAMTIVNLVVQCVVLNKLVHSYEFAPPLYPGYRGCVTIRSDNLLWINYTTLAIVEAIVFTLMAISAFRLYRQGTNGKLSHVIHRDGIMFYVYLLLISATNVILMRILPFDQSIVLSFTEDVLYPVLTTRIVLNIRAVGSKGAQTELHTSCHEPIVFIPLQHVGGGDSIGWQQSSPGS